MLYATAGCRLFIADSPDEYPLVIPPSFWVEIGETESLGVHGGSWEMLDISRISSRDADGVPVSQFGKHVLQRGATQIILGNDPADPGQAILWKAFRSTATFPFRLVFADGVTARQWFAHVTGLYEVFDAANAVMKLQADTLPATKTYRSEET